jgi:hypothetical protein
MDPYECAIAEAASGVDLADLYEIDGTAKTVDLLRKVEIVDTEELR